MKVFAQLLFGMYLFVEQMLFGIVYRHLFYSDLIVHCSTIITARNFETTIFKVCGYVDSPFDKIVITMSAGIRKPSTE